MDLVGGEKSTKTSSSLSGKWNKKPLSVSRTCISNCGLGISVLREWIGGSVIKKDVCDYKKYHPQQYKTKPFNTKS